MLSLVNLGQILSLHSLSKSGSLQVTVQDAFEDVLGLISEKNPAMCCAHFKEAEVREFYIFSLDDLTSKWKRLLNNTDFSQLHVPGILPLYQ